MVLATPGWVRAIALIAFPGFFLAGCASSPIGPSYPEGHGIGTYRVGEPYKINGVWYYPAVDYTYDRTGVASWYGEEFAGRLTANGEIFDLNDLTAAHTTLPMPSIVQVTNLENGRSLQLRINDRGPFVGGRLIDVSRRAAQLLGFENQGTTLVRVTILKDESIAAEEEAMRNSGQTLVAAASGAATGTAPQGAIPSYAAAYAQQPIQKPATPPQPVQVAVRRQTAPMATQREASLLTVARLEPRRLQATQPVFPQQATAAIEPLLSQPMPSRMAPPTHYRFALIAPAEAAELPPKAASAHKLDRTPTSTPASTMLPSPLRTAMASEARTERLFIQAGAFSRQDSAERVKSHMAGLGNVQVTSVTVNGVAMYRVRIGPFASDEQARRLLARVVDSGYRGARVVGD
ncbi:MAG: septal ring lytic transglycosylase RlpA family protein [Alphaproteobacteria bacterium]|nr:septal ring lytic transglycosylase RlpA family protein [Alphaproteobacteria bacterium]